MFDTLIFNLTALSALIFIFYVGLKAYQNQRYNQDLSLLKVYRNLVFNLMLKLPYYGKKLNVSVDQQINHLMQQIKQDIQDKRKFWQPFVTDLANDAWPFELIRDRFDKLHAHYRRRSSSTIYTEYNDEESKLLQQIWHKTSLTNPLYAEWPLINLLEAEVIAICQSLFHGDKGAPGMITHGGSTAILETCKAYVLKARKAGIKNPEIIAPATIHIAFDKAAEILNVKLRKIAVIAEQGIANVVAMDRAITKNTCLLVVSAPSFPYGTIDPIADVAVVAKNRNLPLHVDACLGGFVTAFATDAGFAVPVCDFRIQGVTSMTIGTHKYAQTPNGSSVILFRKDSPFSPTHVYLDWMAGLYASPGIDGTRSGADIALLWAVLNAKGKQNYINETKRILRLKDKLYFGLKNIPDVFIPYRPMLTIVVIQFSSGINPLIVANQLNNIGGWQVNILQNNKHHVLGFHFCLTAVHANQPNFVEEFLSDLNTAVQYAKNHPNQVISGVNSVYSHLAKGVPSAVQEKMGQAYINALHSCT